MYYDIDLGAHRQQNIITVIVCWYNTRQRVKDTELIKIIIYIIRFPFNFLSRRVSVFVAWSNNINSERMNDSRREKSFRVAFENINDTNKQTKQPGRSRWKLQHCMGAAPGINVPIPDTCPHIYTSTWRTWAGYIDWASNNNKTVTFYQYKIKMPTELFPHHRFDLYQVQL